MSCLKPARTGVQAEPGEFIVRAWTPAAAGFIEPAAGEEKITMPYAAAIEATLIYHETSSAIPILTRSVHHIAEIYRSVSATEEYYCNFGVNPDKVSLLASNALRITGSDAEGEMRVIELPDHPFFLGTLFVPQTRSTTSNPHPLVSAFLKAAVETDHLYGRRSRCRKSAGKGAP